MIGSVTRANVVRSGSIRRDLSDVDRYARWEYGTPDAAWLLSASQPISPPESNRPAPAGERLLRRATQATGSFLF